MHGPNGSAKSTIAACVLRALEHYSTLDEGAVYRFHWVFPSKKTVRGAIGFGDVRSRAARHGWDRATRTSRTTRSTRAS
jgi:serine protein kinase